MTSGIYRLNFSNGDFYIGRSIAIESRFNSHKYDLKNGKHNHKMLLTYKKYGPPTGYDILEVCSIQHQINAEVYWINKTNAVELGLNISKGGEDIMIGENNSQSKFSNIQILEVFNYLVYSPEMDFTTIEECTGVNMTVIRGISSGSRHLWLKEEYPEQYTSLIANKNIRKSRSLSNLTDSYAFKRKLLVYPKILSPEGVIYQVDNLTKFCNEHNLQIGNTSSVLNGRRKTHKGWKLA